MSEEKNITSKKLLDKYLAKHYYEAAKAKQEGKPVGWSTSVFPQELYEAFDLHVVFPENHAAAVSAKKEADKFIDYSESKGYSIDICSYARLNLGYADLKKSDVLNLPQPDFICCCNNICNQVIKWYENIAKELNIPLIMIDVAYNVNYDIEQDRVNYIKAQFEEALSQFEKISGKAFDSDRFAEVMDISTKNSRLWKEAMALMAHKPSPLNGFDLFNYMALMVCSRGKKETGEVYALLEKELKQLIAEGKSTFKGEEKFRIMWDGIPCWPYLLPLYKTLFNNGLNLTASTYPDGWAIIYDTGDLDGMARGYSKVANNCNLENQIDVRAKLITDADCDGVIYHMNRSCKVWDIMQYEMARRTEEKTGVPYTIFDGDQSDARAFSQAQYDTRIQGLVEVMAEREKGGVK